MKKFPKQIISKKHQHGVVLLESLLAVLIFSLGVLALAGLQSAMIKNTDDAKYRAEASFLAQQVLSEIWVSGSNDLAAHIRTDDPLPQLPNGLLTVAATSSRDVKVTVNWTLPGGDQHTYLVNARVEGLVN